MAIVKYVVFVSLLTYYIDITLIKLVCLYVFHSPVASQNQCHMDLYSERNKSALKHT
jgi:hypothetical protein